jgi:hypothetical protein
LLRAVKEKSSNVAFKNFFNGKRMALHSTLAHVLHVKRISPAFLWKTVGNSVFIIAAGQKV